MWLPAQHTRISSGLRVRRTRAQCRKCPAAATAASGVLCSAAGPNQHPIHPRCRRLYAALTPHACVGAHARPRRPPAAKRWPGHVAGVSQPARTAPAHIFAPTCASPACTPIGDEFDSARAVARKNAAPASAPLRHGGVTRVACTEAHCTPPGSLGVSGQASRCAQSRARCRRLARLITGLSCHLRRVRQPQRTRLLFPGRDLE